MVKVVVDKNDIERARKALRCAMDIMRRNRKTRTKTYKLLNDASWALYDQNESLNEIFKRAYSTNTAKYPRGSLVRDFRVLEG